MFNRYINYVIVEDTDMMHVWMLIWVDTEEGMIMVWICVEKYWIDFYEWIHEISCIDINEQCACKIIVIFLTFWL